MGVVKTVIALGILGGLGYAGYQFATGKWELPKLPPIFPPANGDGSGSTGGTGGSGSGSGSTGGTTTPPPPPPEPFPYIKTSLNQVITSGDFRDFDIAYKNVGYKTRNIYLVMSLEKKVNGSYQQLPAMNGNSENALAIRSWSNLESQKAFGYVWQVRFAEAGDYRAEFWVADKADGIVSVSNTTRVTFTVAAPPVKIRELSMDFVINNLIGWSIYQTNGNRFDEYDTLTKFQQRVIETKNDGGIITPPSIDDVNTQSIAILNVIRSLFPNSGF